MNKFFVFLCVMLLSFGIARIANAQCDINLGSVSDTPLGTFGDGGVETFGQTFTLPEGCTVLDSFTFFVDNIDTSPFDPTTFKAYVMMWDGSKAVSIPPTPENPLGVLYESAPVSTTVDGTPTFEEFEFTTEGGVELSQGQEYVAFISTAEGGVNSLKDARVDGWQPGPYDDGSFVFHDQVVPNDFSELTTEVWDTHDTDSPLARFDLAFNMTFSSLNVSTPSEGIQEEIDELETINTPKADDANDKLQTALDELAKSPPDEVAALGAIEGAIGDIQAGIDDGDIDATQGIEIIQNLLDISRQLTISAIELAQNTPGRDTDKIDTAFEKLDEGDAFRAIGEYKDAASKYKDALSEAQSALP